MNNRAWQIYILTDPITGRVRYVGVTFRGKSRFNEHISKAIKGGATHRDNWIRSLVAQGLRPLFSTIENGTGEGWQDRERSWIADLRKTCDLVNHTDGGDGTPGCIPTPELRQKWSEMRVGVPYAHGRRSAMLGKKHTPESIEKIRRSSTGRKMPPSMGKKVSAARKGKPLSPEHREKLATAKRGKVLSEAHKLKIAESTRGRKTVRCVETNVIYPSISEAARFLKVNEASIFQAIRKGCRCGGFHFQRA